MPCGAMFASLETETAVFHSGYKTLITTAINAHVMVGGNDLVRNIASVDRLPARITRRTFTWGDPDRRPCPNVHGGKPTPCLLFPGLFRFLGPLAHEYKYFGHPKSVRDSAQPFVGGVANLRAVIGFAVERCQMRWCALNGNRKARDNRSDAHENKQREGIAFVPDGERMRRR